MLLNAIYLYWIVQVLSKETVMAVLHKGVPSIVVFKILLSHISKLLGAKILKAS